MPKTTIEKIFSTEVDYAPGSIFYYVFLMDIIYLSCRFWTRTKG